MVLTITLMAFSCALIACAPTYAVAGIAAPFIVLAARVIQGFAAGGEFGSAEDRWTASTKMRAALSRDEVQ
jgi:hypothetical protein